MSVAGRWSGVNDRYTTNLISVGLAPNDETGDTLRAGGIKLNTCIELLEIDTSLLSAMSADIASSITAVSANSAVWSYATHMSTLSTLTADWQRTYLSYFSIVQDNSGYWNNTYTVVDSGSANWNSTWNTVLANSGSWDTGGGAANTTTTVTNNSGNWSGTYSTVNSNSGTWNAGGGGGGGGFTGSVTYTQTTLTSAGVGTIAFGFDTNQDWDGPDVTAANIETPSVDGLLQIDQTLGLVTDDYTTGTLITEAISAQRDHTTDTVGLASYFTGGTGEDGDLILTGNGTAGTTNIYSGEINQSMGSELSAWDTGATATLWNNTGTFDHNINSTLPNNIYLNPTAVIKNFIGTDKCTLSPNYYTWTDNGFNANHSDRYYGAFDDPSRTLFNVGDEVMLYCAKAPTVTDATINRDDLKSVGRYEFLRIKALDKMTGVVTFVTDKVNFYGAGGNTDLQIDPDSNDKWDIFEVRMVKVHNFNNVILGSDVDGREIIWRSMRILGGLADWDHCPQYSDGHWQQGGSDAQAHPGMGMVGPIRVKGHLELRNAIIDVTGQGYSPWYNKLDHNRIDDHSHQSLGGGIRDFCQSNYGSGYDGYYARGVVFGTTGIAGNGQEQLFGGGGYNWNGPSHVEIFGGSNYTPAASGSYGGYDVVPLAYHQILDASGVPVHEQNAEDKIFLGSAGSYNSISSSSNGDPDIDLTSCGGGIVFIAANEITMSSDSYIYADGSNSDHDAYSVAGPGAGGTILVSCKTFNNNSSYAPPIRARGGTGQTSYAVTSRDAGHGRAIIKYVTWNGTAISDYSHAPGAACSTGGCSSTGNPIGHSGVYSVSGLISSVNLLNGISVTAIDSFKAYVNNLPLTTSLSARYSQDGITWKNSAGVTSSYDILSSGMNTVDLSSLGWSGGNFYYQLQFGTSDTDLTPEVEYAAVDYSPDAYASLGTWESPPLNVGTFELQPRELKSRWIMDSDGPAPKFQLIGDNINSFGSVSAVTLPAPGYYWQDGGTYDLNNDATLDLSVSGHPFRKFWKVKAELAPGSNAADAPSIDDIYFTTTASFSPTAWAATGGTGGSSLSSVANDPGLLFTGVTGVSASPLSAADPISGDAHLRIKNSEPQIYDEWTPFQIPGLIAWFDPTPISAGGGLGMHGTITDQVTSWMPKGMIVTDPVHYPDGGVWTAFANSAGDYPTYTSPASGSGGFVRTEGGSGSNVGSCFTDAFYVSTAQRSLTGIAYTAIAVSVDATQSHACCPALLGSSYHGETGSSNVLFSTTWSTDSVKHGRLFINGFPLGSWTSPLAAGSRGISSKNKNSVFEFLEILHETVNYSPASCGAIAMQEGQTSRELYATYADIMFFDRHPTKYQRQKLFEWMQNRYIHSSGQSYLWDSGW